MQLVTGVSKFQKIAFLKKLTKFTEKALRWSIFNNFSSMHNYSYGAWKRKSQREMIHGKSFDFLW